ncbi:MAG: hypothetical protein HY235_10415 [Acidobacteria bacterium]|nr:hypothetical protein [Acidobacteriota bacterium]
MGDHIADTTLILDVGDHTYITKKSVLVYAKAALLDVATIERVISDPKSKTNWQRQDSCSANLLERICKGLIASKYTKNDIKVLCKKLWGIG